MHGIQRTLSLSIRALGSHALVSRPRSYQVCLRASLALLTTIGVIAASACGAPRSRGAEPQAEVVNLACRLPIGSLSKGFGGFISFPEGAFTSDSRGAMSYDAVHRQWLPVPRQMISPDGSSYAYSEFSKVPRGASIHAVEIASGKDRVVWNEPSTSSVLGWTAAGIYFLRHSPAPGQPFFEGPQLWVLDPASLKPRLVTGQQKAGVGLSLFKAWTGIGGGGAWSKTVKDPPAPPTDVLVRVDLGDGRVTTWFTAAQGSYVNVLGMDSQGHPFLAVTTPSGRGAQVLVLTGPNQATTINASGYLPPADTSAHAVPDTHGVWFASEDGGIWLHRPGGGLRKVGQVPLPPPVPPAAEALGHGPPGPARISVLIAGPCA